MKENKIKGNGLHWAEPFRNKTRTEGGTLIHATRVCQLPLTIIAQHTRKTTF